MVAGINARTEMERALSAGFRLFPVCFIHPLRRLWAVSLCSDPFCGQAFAFPFLPVADGRVENIPSS